MRQQLGEFTRKWGIKSLCGAPRSKFELMLGGKIYPECCNNFTVLVSGDYSMMQEACYSGERMLTEKTDTVSKRERSVATRKRL